MPSLFPDRANRRTRLRWTLGYLTTVLFLLMCFVGTFVGGLGTLLVLTVVSGAAWAFSNVQSKEAHAQARRQSVTGAVGYRADHGVYAGGVGFPELEQGRTYIVVFGEQAIEIRFASSPAYKVRYDEMVEASASGAGAVQSGGGFVGGGFGLEGAAEGMAVAGVLNSLTRKVHNDCVVRFATPTSEATFVMKQLSPAVIDPWLAPVRVAGRARKAQPRTAAPAPVDVAGQLERLAALHGSGALTAEEFAAHKAALLR